MILLERFASICPEYMYRGIVKRMKNRWSGHVLWFNQTASSQFCLREDRSNFFVASPSKEGGLALSRGLRWGCSERSACCNRTADIGKRTDCGTAPTGQALVPPDRTARCGLHATQKLKDGEKS